MDIMNIEKLLLNSYHQDTSIASNRFCQPSSYLFLRLIKCSVSYEQQKLWPIHSFDGQICLDTRLNVRMSNFNTTYENPVTQFQMRVFRFRDETKTANSDQTQAIKCTLYLEETETIVSTKDCSCYTENECSGMINSNRLKLTLVW